MGYYHIKLSPKSKQLCTPVFPFRKCEMQCSLVGLCNSPDILQEKDVSELMTDLEFVCTDINDRLCLTKGTFDDHLEKLKLVVIQIQKAGLKVNVAEEVILCQSRA